MGIIHTARGTNPQVIRPHPRYGRLHEANDSSNSLLVSYVCLLLMQHLFVVYNTSYYPQF